MSAIFVVDRSVKEPSPLVQQLMCAGYHTLCLSDCQTALETLRCVRPDLMIVDVAAMGIRTTVGLLTALRRDDDEPQRPVVPVLIVGAKLSDYRELAGRLPPQGEIVPAAYSTPDIVLEHVCRYVEPAWPPPHGQADRPARAAPSCTTGGAGDGSTHERLTGRAPSRLVS